MTVSSLTPQILKQSLVKILSTAPGRQVKFNSVLLHLLSVTHGLLGFTFKHVSALLPDSHKLRKKATKSLHLSV